MNQQSHSNNTLKLLFKLAFLILLFGTLVAAPLAYSTTRYVADTTQQSGGIYTGPTGTACVYNVTSVITLSAWNSTAESAGDITYVCGTITVTGGTSASGFTFSWNGTSGSPLILRFDTGAILQSTAFGGSPEFGVTAGAILITGHNYITIDGQNTSIIQNTANGSSGQTTCGPPANTTACTVHQASIGVWIDNATGVTVQNLAHTRNIYMVKNAEQSNAAQSNADIWIGGPAANITIDHNDLSDARAGVWAGFDNGNEPNLTISNNTIHHHAWQISTANGSSYTVSSNVWIFGNTIYDYSDWNAGGQAAFHTDGIIAYTLKDWSVSGSITAGSIGSGVTVTQQTSGATATTVSAVPSGGPMLIYGLSGNPDATHIWVHGTGQFTPTGSPVVISPIFNPYIYNDYFYGDLDGGTGAGTAHIACGSDEDPNSGQCVVFNDIVDMSGNTHCAAALAPQSVTGNPILYYNNTIIAPSNCTTGTSPGSIGMVFYDTASATSKNNIFVTNTAPYFSENGGSPSTMLTASDYNDFYNFSEFGFATTYTTLTSWQGTGFDAHSTTGNPSLNGSYVPSGSAVIGTGANLYSTFGCSSPVIPGLGAGCSDYAGNPRPSSGAWTMGAMNAAGGANYTLTITSPTNGTVSQAGNFTCPSSCSPTITAGSSIIATPNSNYSFSSWGGTAGCTGSNTTCTPTGTGTVTATFTTIPQASPPTCSSNCGGTYSNSTTVTFSNPNSGTTVMYYTTDGSTPVTPYGGTAHGTLLSSPYQISVNTAETIKVVAGVSGDTDSTPLVEAYTFTAATPTFSPPAGPISSGTQITMSTSTSGCNSYIYWNFTGTSMGSGTNSTTSSPITTNSTLYAQVIGCPGYTNSTIGSAAYTISSGSTFTLVVNMYNQGSISGQGLTVTPTGQTACTANNTSPYTCTYTGLTESIVLNAYTTGNLAFDFVEWSGPTSCAGTGTSCTVTYSSGTCPASTCTVGALFEQWQPALPTIWVDNNELTCKLTNSCSTTPLSPGAAYTAPAYTLTLGGGSGNGSWSPNAPSLPYCTLGTSRYPATAVGLQNAVTDTEGCRTASVGHIPLGFTIAIPPQSSDQNLNGYCDQYAYCSVNGIVIPQTVIAPGTPIPTAPIILTSTDDAALTALGTPVGAGGIQDNVSLATAPGLVNSDLTGENMYFANGPTNVYANGPTGMDSTISGITTISVLTKSLIPIVPSGSNQLLPLVNGYVSPNLISGGCVTVLDTSGPNAGHSDCVVPQSGPNQTGLYGVFTKAHSAGASVSYSPGPPGNGAGNGNFTLLNGVATNISNYNFAVHMPKIECTATSCIPLSFCAAYPTVGNANPCISTGLNKGMPVLGPAYWEIDDTILALCPGGRGLADQLCPGSDNDTNLFSTGQGVKNNITAISQAPNHIHANRIAAIGDWTSWHTGTNKIAGAILFDGCIYCSLMNSQESQSLRPMGEGHGIDLQGQEIKIGNSWCEGNAICTWLGGGESNPPQLLGFFANVNTQEERIVDSYPYTWLGYGCPNGSNWCGHVTDLNTYWGGSGDGFAQPSDANATLSAGTGTTAFVATTVNPGIGPNTVQLAGFVDVGGTGQTKLYDGTFSTTCDHTSGCPGGILIATTITNAIATGGSDGTVTINGPACGGDFATLGVPTPLTGHTPNATCVNIDTTGMQVTFASGNYPFHDYTSFFEAAASPSVKINNDATAYKINAVDSAPITAVTGFVVNGTPGTTTITVTTSLFSLFTFTGQSVTINGITSNGGTAPISCNGTFVPTAANATSLTYVIPVNTHCQGTAATLTHAAASLAAIPNNGDSTCTVWYSLTGYGTDTGCPMTLTLTAPVTECVTTGCLNIPFYTNFGVFLQKKNGNEFKEGGPTLVTGVKCENSDNSGGQNGICFSDAIRSISGNPTGQNLRAKLTDVTVQGLVSRQHCNGFMDAGGRSSSSGNGSGVSYQLQRISFLNSLGYAISQNNPNCNPLASYGTEIDNAGQMWNVTVNQIDNNTVQVTGFASVDSGVTVVTAGANAACPTGIPGVSGNCTTYTIPPGTGATLASNQALCGIWNPTSTPPVYGNYIYVYGFQTSTNNSTTSGFMCVQATDATHIVLQNPNGQSETIQSGCKICSPGTATPLFNNANPILNSISTSNVGNITGAVQNKGTVTLTMTGSPSPFISGLNPSTLTWAQVSGLGTPGTIDAYCNGIFPITIASTTTLTYPAPGACPIETIPISSATVTVGQGLLAGVDNAVIGYEAFDMLPGDPAGLFGCTNTNFNQPQQYVLSYPSFSLAGPRIIGGGGTALWQGTPYSWTPSMVTIQYPWSAATYGTSGASDNTGTCILTNVLGGPEYATWSHQTVATDSQATITQLNKANNKGINLAIGAAFIDSIMLSDPSQASGWFNANVSTPRQGLNTLSADYDVNSLSTWGMVWASGCGGGTCNAGNVYSADYAEFSNNPHFSESGFAGTKCNSGSGNSLQLPVSPVPVTITYITVVGSTTTYYFTGTVIPVQGGTATVTGTPSSNGTFTISGGGAGYFTINTAETACPLGSCGTTPVAAITTPINGCSGATMTMPNTYFPFTSCAVGFSGYVSSSGHPNSCTVNLPSLTFPDYHLFSLCPSSGPNSGKSPTGTTCTPSAYYSSDPDAYGGVLGAQITAADAAGSNALYTIDALQTANIYTCQNTTPANTCNSSSGPFPDFASLVAATPICTPSGNNPPLTLTCLDSSPGAFFCYTVNDGKPVSGEPGANNCAVGSYTTSTISVNAAETVEIIAAASGYSDSNAVTFAFNSSVISSIPPPNVLSIQ